MSVEDHVSQHFPGATPHQLRSAARRAGVLGKVAAAATAACVLLAVWVDTRWGLTAFVRGVLAATWFATSDKLVGLAMKREEASRGE